MKKMLKLFVLSLLIPPVLLLADAKIVPPVPSVEIGIASWNIERFDAVGPDDQTHPRREQRHLEMIAETILGTGADLIGLQEMVPSQSTSKPSSLDQLLAELNRLEKKRKKKSSPVAVWKGEGGRAHGGYIYTAILWNSTTLELLGEVTELAQLRRGYGSGGKVSSKDELRFPRAPLTARFRVRASPANDFAVIVLHLKARSAGLYGGLDINDRRRRGEWEDLLREWILKPEIQGNLRDGELIVLGDMNERNYLLVELLDRHGTGTDVRGRLILAPSFFNDPRALLFFTSAVLNFPQDYTFKFNAEKGERGREDDFMGRRSNFLDHIAISRSLFNNWDREFRIDYFEKRYPLHDHVRLSDHRPVSIRLLFPAQEASGKRSLYSKVGAERRFAQTD